MFAHNVLILATTRAAKISENDALGLHAIVKSEDHVLDHHQTSRI
jgi:hypothetical protein